MYRELLNDFEDDLGGGGVNAEKSVVIIIIHSVSEKTFIGTYVTLKSMHHVLVDQVRFAFDPCVE